MRVITVEEITQAVKKMAIEAAYYLPSDVKTSLFKARDEEKWSLAHDTLSQIIENADVAKNTCSPICQDTGMAVLFVEIGQDVHIEGGWIEDAINEGVRQAYTEGYLRKSVVMDPVYNRVNTKDNTPSVINYRIVKGDALHIGFAAKGFGSENMSRLYMLKPSDGVEGVKKAILETVELAGPNPCPPIVVGVGIGGTVDRAALIAKKALMRDLSSYNSDPFYAALEKEMLEKVNALGIGPQGYGGKTTALRVLIETYPTHIAGLPVCININCHATRHKEVTL